jgi:hypothetical protein
MKTQRRHELQTNTLAATLARSIEAAKPYSRVGLGVVVALAVFVLVWGYLTAQSKERVAEGWSEYFDGMRILAEGRDPRETLADAAQQYAGTPVGQWSRLALADFQLYIGTEQLLKEKKDGRENLQQAADKYQTLLADSSEPMLAQHATFGLARTHEALGTQDSLEKAREEYRSIGKLWPDSPYVQTANARAKDLDQTDTKDFYDWLAKYEPPRSLAREAGTPGARPSMSQDPLAVDFDYPAPGDEKAPRKSIINELLGDTPKEPSGDKPDEPAAETPAPTPDTPAEPAGDKPADSGSAPADKPDLQSK